MPNLLSQAFRATERDLKTITPSILKLYIDCYYMINSSGNPADYNVHTDKGSVEGNRFFRVRVRLE